MSGNVGGGRTARAAMLVSSLIAAAFVFVATETAAQPSSAAAQPVSQGSLASQIGKPIKPHKLHVAGTSRTLDDILAFQGAHPDLGLHQPAHRPLIPMGEAAYEKAKRDAAATPYRPKTGAENAPPPVTPTTIIRKFTGPKESDTGNAAFPPDSSGAIGLNGIVVPVNTTYNVYSRAGALQLHTTFNALFGTADALAEPRVLYDPLWNRWVISISDPSNGEVWLAISKTSNAQGPFWIYFINITGGTYDYDMLGMTQDTILVTGNVFNGSTFVGAEAFGVPKAIFYNGVTTYQALGFLEPAAIGTVTPPIVQDQNANAFFIASNTPNGTIDLYKGTNMGSGFQSTFTLQAQIPASGLAVPRNANQRNTTLQLDTLDGRFQSPSAQYGNSLWNVKTGASGTFPAIYYYQISTTGNSIIQSGQTYNSGTSDDFNPSIAVNSTGEAIVTWTATDVPNSKNAMMLFSGRQASDGSGMNLGPGTVLTLSNAHLTGNTVGGVEAWGGYSSVALDPYNATNCGGPNHRAAIFNQYIDDASTWGVKVGIVGFC